MTAPCRDGKAFCKYLGWDGFAPFCRHPDHLRPVEGWHCHGKNHIPWDEKHHPDHEPPWPHPVRRDA